MLLQLALKKMLGTKNDREIKKLLPLVQQINGLEPQIRRLTDAALQAKTGELKQKLANGAKLDDILVEAFAVCREAGARVLGMRHFDVQLIGGMALHKGMIAEMKTGEGKTLVATLASYLNALAGKGVHVITVNDYLAKRDSEWMGRIHRFLNLNVGCILNSMGDTERKEQYAADVTYGTNNEFGFDYLRDNMKPNLELYVQRDPFFAIVDEVDSILIDEARTPLIISGPSEDSTDLYYTADRAVRGIKKDLDYTLDEKHRSVTLTEDGVHKLEGLLGIANLYGPENIDLVHHVHASLKAHSVFKKDVDYVSRDGKIIIVDEFTGRLMPGRRWSDGLHQAVEAKEGVKIEAENQTLATITLQNYFRMYEKLSGMTGTADTEAAEFKKIYDLDVLIIPTNRPMIRNDANDLVYRNEAGKYRAVIKDIEEKHKMGRPVLVGTVNIAKSERVAKLLSRINIPHNVLNAKNHEREAEIIANAGHEGQVTIATNMAGRGTDIILGPGVKEKGGLHVIATERHESRRIDNQLRGRAGRQGDRGSSQFYLSLEDDLMRIFASDRVIAIMDKLGMEEDVPISDRLVTRSIETAQKKVEMHHFDQREHLLKYDDVLNKQREVIYSMRRLVLEGKETRALVMDLTREFAVDIVSQFSPGGQSGAWDWKGLSEALRTSFMIDLNDAARTDIEKRATGKEVAADKVVDWVTEKAQALYVEKEKALSEATLRDLERYFFIQSIDHHWKEHLLALDHLKEGIHLRGYAQKDPLVEYRKEGFELFRLLDKVIRQSALTRLYTVRMLTPEEQEVERRRREADMNRVDENVRLSGPSLEAPEAEPTPSAPASNEGELAEAGAPPPPQPGINAAMSFLKNYQAQRLQQMSQAQRSNGQTESSPAQEAGTVKNTQPKLGRNDPCFCGSGKKFKQCHGKEG
ncbi:MAG: preprotein translocase subunit SecA [Bdellovibrionales bacterium]|nr:preprotein translocase subunit SecA [Bdellovibrionales bacterium]